MLKTNRFKSRGEPMHVIGRSSWRCYIW